jgi:hypothetical protein
MLRTVLDLLSCWQGSSGSSRTSMVWRVVPHCVFWCVWRERNARHFEDTETSILEMKSSFFQLFYPVHQLSSRVAGLLYSLIPLSFCILLVYWDLFK